MMFEERVSKILEIVNERHTASVADLATLLGTSESTIRRDITELDKRGQLKRVHGGAARLSNSVITAEYDVQTKSNIHADLKLKIAKYAAASIYKNDFVYIDAGTTTLTMIPYIDAPGAVFVTNGFSHAKALTQRGYPVYITGGRLKLTTEAIVGDGAVRSIEKYNFTKSFMGTNGIDEKSGFTTPDIDEALIKEAAMHPGGASNPSSRGPSTWGSWRTWWNTASLWRRPFSPGFTGRRSLRFSSTRWPSNRAAEVV